MEHSQLLKLIDFFNSISVTEQDVTQPHEASNGQKVVVVTYAFNGKVFTTGRLFYKDIGRQHSVQNTAAIDQYFGSPVYWLDIDVHHWPKGPGEAEVENTVIPEMIVAPDPDFENFLKTLANNQRTGALQQITSEGRSQFYGFNFENNNHWHDLILLIQQIIRSGGNAIDKKSFERLVFKWNDGERVSLSPQFGNRAIIQNLYINIRKIQNILRMNRNKALLEWRKQVIFQGPPGTGKTREAKLLATELAAPEELTIDLIKKYVPVNTEIKTVTDYSSFVIESYTSTHVRVVRTTGNADAIPLQSVIDAFRNKIWLTNQVQKGFDTYTAAIAKFVLEAYLADHVTIIQFHPAYSYEDFVRGISVKTEGGAPVYETENRLLGKLAAEAWKNHLQTTKAAPALSREKWLLEELQAFGEHVEDVIETKDAFEITPKSSILSVDDDAFRYGNPTRVPQWTTRMKFDDLVKLEMAGVNNRQEAKRVQGISGNAKEHVSYYFKVLNAFRTFRSNRPDFTNTTSVEPKKKYCLIIDEINRANLPAVLGELIYALEYRGEVVKSLYSIDGDAELVLPPNLYIIGTMNTADRSAGHIDYAIRRRFAFREVLPSKDPVHPLAQKLFANVSALFVINADAVDADKPVLQRSDLLSPDFRPEDVWIGHSYFISAEKDPAKAKEELRLKLHYEIIPLLKEYLKDGVLLPTANDEIDKLYGSLS